MTESVSRMWFSFVVLMLVACVSEPPTAVDEPGLPSMTASRASRATAPVNYDEELARMADVLPGFAGVHYDGDGSLVVRLRDPGRLSEFSPRILEFLAPAGVPQAYHANAAVELGAARSKVADFDFRQLYDWYLQLIPQLGLKHEITVTDIDEVRNRIVIGVPESSAVDEVRATIEETAAVPSSAILVEQIDKATISASLSVPASSMREKVRPVVGGLKITTTEVCTLGYNVGHHYNGEYVDEYFVTNSHCTDIFGAPTGFVVAGQVSKYDDPIGTEIADPPLFDNTTDSRCPVGRMCRYSDAALFDYDSATSFSHSLVAWPPIGSVQFLQTRQIVGAGDPTAGMTVHKVGQGSGRHVGTVVNTCADVRQYLPDGSDTGRTMLCQGRANYSTTGGDSGGAVVEYFNGDLIQRGLNWGFGGYFSKGNEWNRELREALGWPGHTLGTTVSSGPTPSPPPLTASIGGPSEVPEGGYCTWQGFGDDGTPPYEFSWSGVLAGSGSMISGVVGSSGWLYLTVTDDAQEQANAEMFISVEQSGECLE